MTQDVNVKEKQFASASQAESTNEYPLFSPNVDIWENEEGITVVADLPGVDKDGLSVDLKDNILTLNGKVAKIVNENSKKISSEYEIGDFYRQFKLSEHIDQDNISATLKDGVLNLFLPKNIPSKPRKIPINS